MTYLPKWKEKGYNGINSNQRVFKEVIRKEGRKLAYRTIKCLFPEVDHHQQQAKEKGKLELIFWNEVDKRPKLV